MSALLLLYMKITLAPKQPWGPMHAVSLSDPFVMGETKPWAKNERRFHPRFIQQQDGVDYFCFDLGFVSFLINPDAYFTFFLASGELTSPRLSGLFSDVFHYLIKAHPRAMHP